MPSKALIAAGHKAEELRTAEVFGIKPCVPEVDFLQVREHVHAVIGAIEPNDSVERFEGLGVHLIQATGRFTGPREVMAGGVTVRAKFFVVSTGSFAGVPPIPGLSDVPYLTNETVFDLTECPEHLIVIGGGPIGCELAQAHRRLGARVTVLEMFSILAKDDLEAAEVVRRQLQREDVKLREGVQIVGVSEEAGGVVVDINADGVSERINGSHVLVAAATNT